MSTPYYRTKTIDSKWANNLFGLGKCELCHEHLKSNSKECRQCKIIIKYHIQSRPTAFRTKVDVQLEGGRFHVSSK